MWKKEVYMGNLIFTFHSACHESKIAQRNQVLKNKKGSRSILVMGSNIAENAFRRYGQCENDDKNCSCGSRIQSKYIFPSTRSYQG